jgi:hypothetical protein
MLTRHGAGVLAIVAAFGCRPAAPARGAAAPTRARAPAARRCPGPDVALRFRPPLAPLRPGDTVRVSATTCDPASGGPPRPPAHVLTPAWFRTADPRVATVDAAGLVTARAPGETVLVVDGVSGGPGATKSA